MATARTNATRIAQQLENVDDLDPACVETFEDAKEALEEVERQLAKQLKIRGYVRRTLIARDRSKKLVEDELVVRWHELLANYNDWTQSDAWEAPPSTFEDTGSPPRDQKHERAAEAALAAFGTPRLGSTERLWSRCLTYGGPFSHTETVSRTLLSWLD